jgi:multimeric flavodoxin WrbA
MKILVISGANNLKGMTQQCVDALLEGAASQGAKHQTILLPKKKLERCRQCDPDGWGLCAMKGRCVIKDDFAAIFKKLKAADLVIFATPVYFHGQAESLRGFLERVYRVCFKWGKHDSVEHKPAVGVAVAGGGGGGAIPALQELEGMLRGSGFDIVDAYPVRRQNLRAKLAQFRLAGNWLATCPTSADETPSTLRKPPKTELVKRAK